MSNPRDTTQNTETEKSPEVIPLDTNQPDMETSFSQSMRNTSPQMNDSSPQSTDRPMSNPDTEIDFPNLNRNMYDRGDHVRTSYPYRPRRNTSYDHENEHDIQLRVKPPRYDGKDDIYEYLDSFEICCQINRWSPYLKGLHLANSLTGSARGILTELQRHEKTDIYILINKLKERYGSQNQNVIFRTELQSRTRKIGETIPELAQNIKKLTLMAYPNATKEFTDTLARDHFIEAINDETLRMKLREADPHTLSEATQIATRFEAYKTAENRRKQSFHVSSGRTEANHSKYYPDSRERSNNTDRHTYKQDTSGSEETVTQLTKTLDKLANAFEKLANEKSVNTMPNHYRNENPRDRFPGHSFHNHDRTYNQRGQNTTRSDSSEMPRHFSRSNDKNTTPTQYQTSHHQENENRSSWRPTRRPDQMRRANRFQ